MVNVTLRTTTPAEYEQLVQLISADYAAQQTRAGQAKTYAEAREEAEQSLPEGPRTPDNLFLTALDGDQPVGCVWLVLEPADRQRAWVNTVWINAECRGKGYGRALMEAAERVAAEHGVKRLELNVFAHNAVAVKLYDELGYQVASQRMVKTL